MPEEDVLDRLNRLMAPLKHRKRGQEAIRAHTATKTQVKERRARANGGQVPMVVGTAGEEKELRVWREEAGC